MTQWRRAVCPGGTFFFTLVTEARQPILTTEQGRSILRTQLHACRRRWPFEILAMVLLPDHLHTLWRLPDSDSDYSRRWGWIKKEFTKAWLADGGCERLRSASRCRNRRRGVWQRRFWEHAIRDQEELNRHLDYIHYNPVKHGHAVCARDWPWSSFSRHVRAGFYSADWGCGEKCFDDIAASMGE